jgi:hypothetical protein
LSGDLDDAYRHAVSAYEWISHYRRQDRDHSIDRAGPEQLDIAAIPFCLITQNHAENAIGFMREWKDWYAYEIGEHLFGLLKQAEPAASQTGSIISKFLNGMTDDIGIIVSALSFLELDDIQRNQLIKKLSKACNKEKELETNDNFHQEANYHLQDGLLKASAIAVSMGFSAEALTISSRAPHERSGVWGFSDHFSDRHVLPFLAHVALNAAVKGEELREQDILPKELYEICSGVTSVSSSDFRKKLKERLESCVRSKQDQSKEDNKSISPELKRNAESFIDGRLEPLLILANAFVGLLRAPVNKGDKAFLALLETWQRRGRSVTNIVPRNSIASFNCWGVGSPY